MRHIVIYFIILLSGYPSYGQDPKNTCKGLLNACNVVIAAQDRQISDLKVGLKQLEDKCANNSAGWSIPLWVPAVAGILVGGFIVNSIKK